MSAEEFSRHGHPIYLSILAHRPVCGENFSSPYCWGVPEGSNYKKWLAMGDEESRPIERFRGSNFLQLRAIRGSCAVINIHGNCWGLAHFAREKPTLLTIKWCPPQARYRVPTFYLIVGTSYRALGALKDIEDFLGHSLSIHVIFWTECSSWSTTTWDTCWGLQEDTQKKKKIWKFNPFVYLHSPS